MNAHAACLWVQLVEEGEWRPAVFVLRRDHTLVLLREVVFDAVAAGHCLPSSTHEPLF